MSNHSFNAFNAPPAVPSRTPDESADFDRRTQHGAGFSTPAQEAMRTALKVSEAESALRLAETFEDIRAALGTVEEVTGQSKAKHSRAELLGSLRPIEALARARRFDEAEDCLRYVTSGLGLRGAVARTLKRERALAAQYPPTGEQRVVRREDILRDPNISLKDRLTQVQSFDELDAVLEGIQGISGSEWYSPYEINQMVQNVKNAFQARAPALVSAAVQRTTGGEGLRETVGRLAFSAMTSWGKV